MRKQKQEVVAQSIALSSLRRVSTRSNVQARLRYKLVYNTRSKRKLEEELNIIDFSFTPTAARMEISLVLCIGIL